MPEEPGKPKPMMPIATLNLHRARARGVADAKRAEVRAAALSGNAALIESVVLQGLIPGHRRVAELRSCGVTVGKIAKELGYTRKTVSEILRKPEVRATYEWYRRSIPEKVAALQAQAANTLPRAMRKVEEALEREDIDPRHTINAMLGLTKVMRIGNESGGDTVKQKIVIHLSPDAARQLGPQGVGMLAPVAAVEWEEVQDAPE